MLPCLGSCSSGYSGLRSEQLFPVTIRVSVAIGCLSAGFTPVDGVHLSVRSSQATAGLRGVDVRSLGGFCPGRRGWRMAALALADTSTAGSLRTECFPLIE